MNDPDDRLDELLAPVADAIAAQVITLAQALSELDLIDTENPGMPRWNADIGTGELVTAIEVEGRLYTLQDVETVVATRIRDDGRYEHAVIDENGLPIEWRTAIRPEFN